MNYETLVLQVEQSTDDGTIVGMLFCPAPGHFAVDLKIHDLDDETNEERARVICVETFTGPRQALEAMLAPYLPGDDFYIRAGASPSVNTLYPVLAGIEGSAAQAVCRALKPLAEATRTLDSELPSMAGAL